MKKFLNFKEHKNRVFNLTINQLKAKTIKNQWLSLMKEICYCVWSVLVLFLVVLWVGILTLGYFVKVLFGKID